MLGLATLLDGAGFQFFERDYFYSFMEFKVCEVGKYFIFPLNQPHVANQQKKKVCYAQYKQTRLLGHGTLISSILFNSFS